MAVGVEDYSVAALLPQLAAALAHLEAPRSEAEGLLAALLECPRSRLLAFPERVLDAETRARLKGWLERRQSGEPLAYLTGRRGFWSLELDVSPAVLVPRPDTETLVAAALARWPAALAQPAVLDLGTGSGAIALALAVEHPEARMTAVDRSPAALAVARGNALGTGLAAIEWLLSDWYAALEGRRFDLIVANPPYLAADDPALSNDGVCREPRSALVAGPGGLEDIAIIVAGAAAHLYPDGWLLVEHGALQSTAVQALFHGAGLAEVGTLQDFGGHPRVTLGRVAVVAAGATIAP
jgi:release factor glutamine methyltransferase